MSTKVQVPVSKFYGFDHLHFWVGNAKQAADWYIARFGFKPLCYKGLETGSKDVVTHVIAQNNVKFAFSSPLNPGNKEFGSHIEKHGDGVKDVAFVVDDCKAVYEAAIANGAIKVSEPKEEKDDQGSVILASIQTYGDTIHTLVERKNYNGVFLPGFKAVTKDEPLTKLTPDVNLDFIDHVVGNQSWNEMEPVATWYSDKLGFRRFWSVDDKQVHTEYSALRSIVMTDDDETIKMPINEPAKGKKKSQIEEYVDFYGGAGVQHIALNTKDVLTSVQYLKDRGVEFLPIPKSYYDNLRLRLSKASIKVKEDLNVIEKLNILVDFDDQGYLLQIFTKPCEDRPTLFLEIIQRANNSGFGVGNFIALFKAIEDEQERRGTLV